MSTKQDVFTKLSEASQLVSELPENFQAPEGQMLVPAGSQVAGPGQMVVPEGMMVVPMGSQVAGPGQMVVPEGSVVLPPGSQPPGDEMFDKKTLNFFGALMKLRIDLVLGQQPRPTDEAAGAAYDAMMVHFDPPSDPDLFFTKLLLKQLVLTPDASAVYGDIQALVVAWAAITPPAATEEVYALWQAADKLVADCKAYYNALAAVWDPPGAPIA